MENLDIIVGLDIGTTKIAVVVGRENEEGKIEILGYGNTESLGVKRGFVANIKQTVDSIQKAVEKASEASNVNIEEVYVGIAGQFIKSIQHRGSTIIDQEGDYTEITKEDILKFQDSMKNLAVDPGEMIINIIPQEYTVNGEPGIKDPVGMAGNSIETNFHIITAQVTAAQNINRCVKDAGLSMKYIILEPIASAESVLSEDEKEAGVALVDIGGGTTDIAIFKDGILRHTAVIPFGGEIITEDIKEGCSILKKYAENLKLKFGSALSIESKTDTMVSIPGLRGRPPKEISIKNLSAIIQARMDEILKLVYYQIKVSGYEKKLIAGIVLTGGGSLLKDIQQLTQFRTGMDARIGYPNEFLSSDTNQELNSPIFSTAIGLVKTGIENSNKLRNKNEQPGASKKKQKFASGVFKWIGNKLTEE